MTIFAIEGVSISQYNTDAFQFISNESTQREILNTAAILGVSAGAIAGAIAEEHHAYTESELEYTKHYLADLTGLAMYTTHKDWSDAYTAVGGDTGYKPSWTEKLAQPVYIDYGPANFKMTTAIRSINQYIKKHPDDPLQISRYANDYNELAEDLVDPDRDTTVKFYGLMIEEAKKWFEDERAWGTDWNSLSQPFKDALYITYANLGPKQIRESYQKNYVDKGRPYEPMPGFGTAAGMNHLANAAQIGAAIGDTDYAGTLLPANAKSSFAARAMEESVTALAYRYALVNLNAVALTGLDYSARNRDYSLEIFDPETDLGELTEQYLIDRAELLFVKATRDSMDITEHWDNNTFEDRTSGLLIQGPQPSNGSKYIFGSAYDDPDIKGGEKDDHLYGGAGHDTLEGLEGDDYLEGGKGHDVYKVDNGDEILDTDGRGEVRFKGKMLVGGVHRVGDLTGVYQSSDLRYAYTLNQGVLTVRHGVETIRIKDYENGDLGIQLIDGANQDETHYMGDGMRPIDGVLGTPFRDITIYGDELRNFIHGDQATFPPNPDDPAHTGHDIIYGREGNDEIWGDYGNDVLFGDEGQDHVVGGPGDVMIFGGQEYDPFDAHDWLQGAYGNDVIYGGLGDDIIEGDYKIIADLEEANQPPPPGHSNYVLEYGRDWVQVRNMYYGSLDPDPRLRFENGDDILYGGSGNDDIRGGSGSDELFGGEGNDWLYGDDVLAFPVGYEKVFGDHLDGGSGQDVLFGGSGGDTLLGGDDTDWLYGEEGNDTLDGGRGDDYLDGGSGADQYYFGKDEGTDLISSLDSNDSIVFKEGISPSDVKLSKSISNPGDLVVGFLNATGRLFIKNYQPFPG